MEGPLHFAWVRIACSTTNNQVDVRINCQTSRNTGKKNQSEEMLVWQIYTSKGAIVKVSNINLSGIFCWCWTKDNNSTFFPEMLYHQCSCWHIAWDCVKKKKKKDSYSELKSNSEDLDSEYEVTSSLSLFHFLFCGHKNDIKTFKF